MRCRRAAVSTILIGFGELRLADGLDTFWREGIYSILGTNHLRAQHAYGTEFEIASTTVIDYAIIKYVHVSVWNYFYNNLPFIGGF